MIMQRRFVLGLMGGATLTLAGLTGCQSMQSSSVTTADQTQTQTLSSEEEGQSADQTVSANLDQNASQDQDDATTITTSTTSNAAPTAACASCAGATTTAAAQTASTQAAVIPAITEGCVFSGKPIDPTVGTVNFQSKEVGFCCDDCKDKWAAMTDEQKAARLVSNTDGTPLANLDTTCSMPTSAAACSMPSSKTACSMPGSTAATTAGACPFSGKPVDPTAGTVSFQGKDIGFCCDDCIDKWNALSDDQKTAKLTSAAANTCGAGMDATCSMHSTKTAAVPASAASCVFSGKPAVSTAGTVNYNGTEVGFCCDKCRAKWDTLTDDQKASKVAYLKIPATDCPMSGKPSKPSAGTVNFQGTKVGFCCKDCRQEWAEATEEKKTELVSDLSN